MMGRVAELGCGHAAHTAAHRAAEHAETDRHTHAAPHLPGARTTPHLSGARAETDLSGPATPGTRPAAPDAAGQFGRGYVGGVARLSHVRRQGGKQKPRNRCNSAAFRSGRRDLNPRPLDPQSSALPNCATARSALYAPRS